MKVLKTNIIIVTLAALLVASCGRQENSNERHQKSETEIIYPEISHSYVTSFAEDKWGHIWIGTSHGLNKNTVNSYHQYLASEDSLTLDDNHISALLCDSKSRLWVSTLNNHVSLLKDNGDFKRIPVDCNKMGRTQLVETPDGRILLNAENAVLVYDEQTGKMRKLIDSSDKNIGCYAIEDGKIIIAYSKRIDIYSSHPFNKAKTITLSSNYRTASLRNNHEIWLSSKGELCAFNLEDLVAISVPRLLQDYINSKKLTVFQVIETDTNTVVLNTKEGGVVRYNYQDNTLVTEENENYPYNIGKYNVSCLFTDSHHNLWIGSDGGGYRIVNREKGFFHSLDDNSFFSGMQITSLACDSARQSLWVVAFGRELYHFDLSNHVVKLVWLTSSNEEGGIKDIAVNNQGKLVFTTRNQLVEASYNNKTFKIEKTYSIEMPEGLVIDKDGRSWVLVRGGKLLRQSLSGTFDQIYQYPNQKRAKSLIILLQNGNVLYSGMDSHLIEITSEGNQARTILEAGQIIKECNSGHFIPEVLKEDLKGNIWIGTQSDGVIIFNRENESLSAVKGINCEEISSIEQDASGHLWIGTQYGLYECGSDGECIKGFFKHDGLSSNSFSENASAFLPDSTIVFGELQGITAFKPMVNHLKKNMQIVFEDLKVNNTLVIPGDDQPIDKPLSEFPEIKLSHYQNNFSISYAVLDYRREARIHYYYMLKGYDKEWTDAGGNQEAFYSNIPSGDYTFCVRIEDHSKKGEYFTQSINLHIKAAPWATWWAYLIYILIISLIARHYYLLYRSNVVERERVRKAEEEKEQEQRTNDINKRYFANVAHQLRTPVTMISAPIKQLVDDKELKGKKHQLLQVVNHNVDRMIRLVNQLMDFNKLETDALNLHVRLVDIAPLLQRTLDIYQMNAEEKGITFKTEGLNENCFTYVDTDKLVNIVDNLLSNAIKFTPQGGYINLCMKRITRDEAGKSFNLTPQDNDSQYVFVEVSDTGPGIPEKELKKIFERYYQVDSQQEGYYNWGTGIGLYYSLRLAELHHGHIIAENRKDRIGASFKLIIPASQESYTEKERIEEKEPKETIALTDNTDFREEKLQSDTSDLNKPRVLVVDDDTDISYFLRMLLSDYYRVTCCYDVDSAKKQLHEHMPDIVVSDVVMTGDSGIELCKFIKTELQFCHIPVILLTAKNNMEDQLEGIGAGADAYLSKPFNSAYLLQIIETTLRNRERVKKSLTEENIMVTKNSDGLLPQDKVFLDELYKIMDKELANDEFNVSAIVEEMHLSHSKFIYKVKGLTGLTPSEFFKTYKLNKAAQLLKKGEYNISEVAYMTGFSTLAHFSKVFKKKFGVSPSQYINGESPTTSKDE